MGGDREVLDHPDLDPANGTDLAMTPNDRVLMLEDSGTWSVSKMKLTHLSSVSGVFSISKDEVHCKGSRHSLGGSSKDMLRLVSLKKQNVYGDMT